MDYIDEHATANEDFEFKCAHCGNLIKTRPGGPGSAQSTCKRCGHTMLYHVDLPQRPIGEDVQLPINVKLTQSKTHADDFQIEEPLSLEKSYCFLCPKCDKIHTITPKQKGERGIIFNHCSLRLYFRVMDTNDPGQPDNLEPDTNVRQRQTDLLDNGETAKAYIKWSYWGMKHQVLLDKNVTIIGRDIIKYPCDLGTSGCNSCWRLSKDQEANLCDIMIRDKYISACSLEIRKEYAASGGILYRAIIHRASNPVLIQRREYPKDSSIYLNDGDIIVLGKTTLTFKLKRIKNDYHY